MEMHLLIMNTSVKPRVRACSVGGPRETSPYRGPCAFSRMPYAQLNGTAHGSVRPAACCTEGQPGSHMKACSVQRGRVGAGGGEDALHRPASCPATRHVITALPFTGFLFLCNSFWSDCPSLPPPRLLPSQGNPRQPEACERVDELVRAEGQGLPSLSCPSSRTGCPRRRRSGIPWCASCNSTSQFGWPECLLCAGSVRSHTCTGSP